jgi:hypothetical protein
VRLDLRASRGLTLSVRVTRLGDTPLSLDLMGLVSGDGRRESQLGLRPLSRIASIAAEQAPE